MRLLLWSLSPNVTSDAGISSSAKSVKSALETPIAKVAVSPQVIQLGTLNTMYIHTCEHIGGECVISRIYTVHTMHHPHHGSSINNLPYTRVVSSSVKTVPVKLYPAIQLGRDWMLANFCRCGQRDSSGADDGTFWKKRRNRNWNWARYFELATFRVHDGYWCMWGGVFNFIIEESETCDDMLNTVEVLMFLLEAL